MRNLGFSSFNFLYNFFLNKVIYKLNFIILLPKILGVYVDANMNLFTYNYLYIVWNQIISCFIIILFNSLYLKKMIMEN